MFSTPLELHTVCGTQLFDFLYSYFHRDFVANRTHINGTIYINPQSHRKDDGKEFVFWHLTSREQEHTVKVGNRYEKVKERLPDFARAERIEWVKLMIENHTHPSISVFYHQESNYNRDIRLYLWAEKENFVVILQKIGKRQSYLVTSFYVDHDKKKADYRKRLAEYRAGTLCGCEWF